MNYFKLRPLISPHKGRLIIKLPKNFLGALYVKINYRLAQCGTYAKDGIQQLYVEQV